MITSSDMFAFQERESAARIAAVRRHQSDRDAVALDAVRVLVRQEAAARRAAAFADRLKTAAAPAPRRPARRSRAAALTLLSAAGRPRARAAVAPVGSRAARLDLDGEIGWDVTAAGFGEQLRAVTAGRVELHLNSPGGDVFDGLAIFNALRDHPAHVTVVIDGLAASAASFIAMAGDRVVMNRAAQFMIHDAFSLTVGDENDHLRKAELLGRVSETIAGVYASRAGGTAGEWRAKMRAETWFSPAEAVEAGLADEAVEDEPAESIAALRATLRGAR